MKYNENEEQNNSHKVKLDPSPKDDPALKCKSNAQYSTNRGTRRSVQSPDDPEEENSTDGAEEVPKESITFKITYLPGSQNTQ